MSREHAVLAVALVVLGAPCTAPPGPPQQPGWQVFVEGSTADSAVLSAWGAGSGHLILVGGPVGNGGESAVFKWDGQKIFRLHPGGTETYWWTSGLSASDIWMSGEHGRITHFDGVTFTDQPRAVDATIWGIIPFSPSDVWAVGGQPGRGATGTNDVVLHFDGTLWTRESLPGTPRHVALLKTWGTSATDLYVVGERATVWHRTAAGWTLESADWNPPLATGTLFSVHGCGADDVYAAGGDTVLHRTGGTWKKLSIPDISVVTSVACGKDRVAVIGFGGLKYRLVGDATTNETTKRPFADLHGAFNDSEGGIWVVGGDWSSQPTAGGHREGCIARWGTTQVSATFAP